MEYQNVEEFAKKLEIKVEDQSHNQVIKIITNERDTTYHCNKKFANPNYFRKHSALHLSGEPFQCTICGKGFKKNEYLKQMTEYLVTCKNMCSYSIKNIYLVI